VAIRKVAKHLEGQMRTFGCVVDANGPVLTIGLRGEIDLSAVEKIEPVVQSSMSDGQGYVVLDLASVSFIDSTGLRLLLRLKHRAEDSKLGSLLLGRVSQPVRSLLDITGLTERFAYVEGEVPDTFYCPACAMELSVGADRCTDCGDVF
jgi:anti-sigma B factor antagonist